MIEKDAAIETNKEEAKKPIAAEYAENETPVLNSMEVPYGFEKNNMNNNFNIYKSSSAQNSAKSEDNNEKSSKMEIKKPNAHFKQESAEKSNKSSSSQSSKKEELMASGNLNGFKQISSDANAMADEGNES